MVRRRKHLQTSKLPVVANQDDHVLRFTDYVSLRNPLENRNGDSPASALVPVIDIYSARALLGGIETSLEERMQSLEERLNKRMKDRDWRIMERIRQLQEQQKRRHAWWRWWDRS